MPLLCRSGALAALVTLLVLGTDNAAQRLLSRCVEHIYYSSNNDFRLRCTPNPLWYTQDSLQAKSLYVRYAMA